MSQVHSVLLDLDGTLIDSRSGIAASALAALRSLGHAPGPTLDITPFIGPPLQDMMRMLLLAHGDRVGDDRVDEAVLAYRQHYGEIGLFDCALYPGVREALQEMHRAGLRIYLATSKRELFARRILEHLDLASYFQAIHGSVPSGELDHKPELLSHILMERNIAGAHGVMVGDRHHDVAGAHAVGMRSLGVLWGYGSREELEAAGAGRLVETPSDLARAVMTMLER
ncbi:putative haloacid dehalogenase-like hydrolase family protein; Phosphoglycolate phosphatase [Bradyrhizobium sp. ORS 375]|uniref:HAD hydrolase-like protein n=1 Tax=Bradyrhizobium sp. (strain ORS 375) TaxID=566679 RepID=UPI000240A166|nr:HAD hydrolase-like protein [Bradyrhizobium sp. ORS 375]CCD92251.1 putative haloacid dehalogenase-like hydrolase family protein; Phosphoglycolate phosphatase [Bradyrhizobium sp. ORS 375]